LAASYIFEHPIGGVDEIKIRGAYGQTGNRASFGALFSPDTSGTIGGNSGIFIGTRAGDKTLKPERQKEVETGVDATLANGRAQVSLTLYQKNISDLLLERTLAPSSGQENQIFSSASTLRDQGIEASLTVQPVLVEILDPDRTKRVEPDVERDPLDVEAFEQLRREMKPGRRCGRRAHLVRVHRLVPRRIGQRLGDVRRQRRLPVRLPVQPEPPAAFAQMLEELDRAVPPPGPQAPRRPGEPFPDAVAHRLEKQDLPLRPHERNPCGHHPGVVDDDECTVDLFGEIAERPVSNPAVRAAVHEQP